MEDERKRILEMLQQGQVTVEQAAELLNALDATRQTDTGPGAPRRDGEPTPPEGTNWAHFGRSLAQQVQRHVASAISGLGGRQNFSDATLSRPILERWEDATSYRNFGHLTILDNVPEDLLDRKVSSFMNFGHVEGPAGLIALLQQKCDTNFGRFTATDQASPTSPRPPRPPKPPRAPRAQRPRGREAEAVLTSYAIEDGRQQMTIECHTGNLELEGTESDTFRLIARKPLHRGETPPDGWENQFKWSADRDGARHTFTLGVPDDPDATNDLTFRFEIPTQADIAAETAGGDIAASSLSGRLDVKTAGGDIAFSKIEGAAAANTAGGDINVSEVEGELTAETGGGDIAFSKIEGSATARTGGGDLSASDVEGELTMETGGGDISISDVEGTVNARTGGGDVSASDVEGELSIGTGGGDISASKIKGPVKATTGGGDGAASEVEGDLTIETGAGDIAVSKVAGSVTAISGGGDVSLADVEGDAIVEAEGGSTALSNISGSVTTGGR